MAISKGRIGAACENFAVLDALKVMWISKGKTAPKFRDFENSSPERVYDPPLFSSGFGRKGGGHSFRTSLITRFTNAAFRGEL